MKRLFLFYFFTLSPIPFVFSGESHIEFFEARIRPVLVQECFECHSLAAPSPKGGLRVDSLSGILQGGESGSAIHPGQPEESLILTALRQDQDHLKMPPKRKLSLAIVEDFRRWIAEGAKVSESFISAPTSGPSPSDSNEKSNSKQPPPETFWAFQPVTPPAIPENQMNASFGAPSPIDQFLIHMRKAKGVTANPPADPTELLRRVSFDLTGLPPSPETLNAFLEDPSQKAYTEIVDQLLASPHYGEQWGRHWLDWVRYADTNGVDENYNFPNAWRYRDYVIRSFNQDKPYFQFLREQIAGDLLPSTDNVLSDADQVIATGWWSLGPKMLAEQDKEKMLYDIVDEQIDIFSRTVLGLTVSCARCHDHKFDPITAKDYYALAGILSSTTTMANTNHVSYWVEAPIPDPDNPVRIAHHQTQIADLRQAISQLEMETPRNNTLLEQKQKELQTLTQKGPELPKAMAVREGRIQDLPVHIRGNYLNPSEKTVPRGFPQVLTHYTGPYPIPEEASGRMELANWLADPQHPLTARVLVNRVWQYHFGEGLVRSSSNFGYRGTPPTHPELLDYLASEFIRSGGSVKALHRSILLSNAYRMSSQFHEDNHLHDPENLWLWRQNRKRLEAESFRDALLFVSNSLDLQVEGILKGADRGDTYYQGKDSLYHANRRALYLPIVRNRAYDLFSIFDYSDSGMHLEKRPATIVSHQALFVLNNPLVWNQAKSLARMAFEQVSPSERVEWLYFRILSRPPTPLEKEISSTFLQGEGAPDSTPKSSSSSGSVEDPLMALTVFCQTLLASNEFLYIN